jgi:uncharacterized protein (DUF488 family)
MSAEVSQEVFTVGHSTHSLERLVSLLGRHRVTCIADVRIIPRSRRLPHIAAERLAQTLPAAGVRYVHMGALGGRRKPAPESLNAGWRVDGFRGYADYMQTDCFEAALGELMGLARECRTSVMCAEGLWWRCHRRLISDSLVARGWEVAHIAPDGALDQHELTPFAELREGRLTYPPAQGALT